MKYLFKYIFNIWFVELFCGSCEFEIIFNYLGFGCEIFDMLVFSIRIYFFFGEISWLCGVFVRSIVCYGINFSVYDWKKWFRK